MALAKALRHLDETRGDPGDHLYAVEARSGARSYTIMSPDQAWRTTADSAGPVHLYEVLTGACNMYLDVEWKLPCELEADAQRGRIDAIATHVCNRLLAVYGKQALSVSVASASGWRSRTEYKCSWHVHITSTRVCWANSYAVGQFVRDCCADIPEVDKIPYAATGQNWRCVGSAKASEPLRKFMPANYDTFMACTIQQPVACRTLIYPDASPVASPAMTVPSVISALAESLNTGGTARMIAEDRCVVPFAERQYCEHAGRRHRSNHQYAVINLQTLMWKMCCHACPDAISAWQPFADQSLVAAAFAQQCEHFDYTYAPLPMKKVHQSQVCTSPDSLLYNLRTVGPPRYNDRMVACRDAIYCRHHD